MCHGRIVANMKIIDMHCDTIHKIWKANAAGENKNLADDAYMLNITKKERHNRNYPLYLIYLP